MNQPPPQPHPYAHLIEAGEFWTARQRQANALHEVSYRACFKPQLPAWFISRFTAPGDLVFDPFAGRGTTAVEAALLGRRVASNDINPLSRILTEPRLELPPLADIHARLSCLRQTLTPASGHPSPKGRGEGTQGTKGTKETKETQGTLSLDFDHPSPAGRGDGGEGGEGDATGVDLSMFYAPRTLGNLLALRAYLHERRASGAEDAVDRWLRMVATNRLTGHSPGFFSVYTLPPNQAASPKRQIEINRQRNQTPPERDILALIWKKTRQLHSELTPEQIANLHAAARDAQYLTIPANVAQASEPADEVEAASRRLSESGRMPLPPCARASEPAGNAKILLGRRREAPPQTCRVETRRSQRQPPAHLLATRYPLLATDSVALTVTSPPFLDTVQYADDNWLRCWFNHIDTAAVAKQITITRTLEAWDAFIRPVFRELHRVTRPGGHVAFEVGEIRKGTIRLEETVVPAAEAAGFVCQKILINEQTFTKTANIWGVSNNTRGTNTNRIVLLRKT